MSWKCHEIFQNEGSNISIILSKIKADLHLTAWMDHKETDFTKEIASYLHVYMPAIYVFTCQLFTCLHANYLHVYMPTVVTRSFKKEKKKKKLLKPFIINKKFFWKFWKTWCGSCSFNSVCQKYTCTTHIAKSPVGNLEHAKMAELTGKGSFLTQLQNLKSLLTIQINRSEFHSWVRILIKTWSIISRLGFRSERILRDAWFCVKH